MSFCFRRREREREKESPKGEKKNPTHLSSNDPFFPPFHLLHLPTSQTPPSQVVMAYTVGVAASLAAFWAVPSSAAALQWACVFAIGFFLYGPQMLIGLCGAELVGPESVGASEGFLGWVAYLGAANAGVPLSLIVKNYGWGAYFSALLCACAGALLLLAPMVGLRSHVQREADEEKKLA